MSFPRLMLPQLCRITRPSSLRSRLVLGKSAFMSTSAGTAGQSATGVYRPNHAQLQPDTLAISEHQDDVEIRNKYRPYLLPQDAISDDWVSALELDNVIQMARTDLNKTGSRLKVLVLYGSLRKRCVSPRVRRKAETDFQYVVPTLNLPPMRQHVSYIGLDATYASSTHRGFPFGILCPQSIRWSRSFGNYHNGVMAMSGVRQSSTVISQRSSRTRSIGSRFPRAQYAQHRGARWPLYRSTEEASPSTRSTVSVSWAGG